MADLGSFGIAPADKQQDAREPDTFTYFGQRVRLATDVDELELVDLMESFRRIDAGDFGAIAAIKDAFRIVVHSEDFAAFWQAAKTNRQDIEALAQLWYKLLEAVTDRPTQRPGDSLTGPPGTAQSSPTGSFEEEFPGRPDLQLVRAQSTSVKQRLRELAG